MTNEETLDLLANKVLLDLLIGRKIVGISRMTPQSAEEAGLDFDYMHIPVEIILEGSEEHGSIKLFALSDPEGNDGGVMMAKIGAMQTYLDEFI
tara:strand:- start:801 stop:1082 length:282 start_codon:yes stop_codon:yes gene_type:complete